MLSGSLRFTRTAAAAVLVLTTLTAVTVSESAAIAVVVEEEEPQTAGMRMLAEAVDGDIVANFRNGVPATLFLTYDTGADSPEAAARAFLDANPLVYFQTDPDLDLVVDEVEPDSPIVRIRQTYLGLDLIGPSMTVITDGTNVFGTIGEVLGARGLERELNVDVVPELTAEQATEIVDATGATVLGVPRLALLVPGMFAIETETAQLADDVVLVWEASTNDPSERVMVDADTGDILLRLSREYGDSGFESFDFELFDSDGATAKDSPGCYSFWAGEHIGDEDGVDHPGNAEDVAAYNSMRQAYGRYHQLLGRHSFDGDGEQIELFLRTPGRAFKVAPNASWTSGCDLIQASPGWAVSDILYHELTHGVVRATSDLVYKNESGALNEHFSDVMAVLLEHPSDPLPEDWVIGEDLPGGAIRDIPKINLNRYSEKDPGTDDDGMVHTNSAIPNYATYMMVMGGRHPDTGVRVFGVGPNQIRELEYLTMLSLGENATMAEYANTMVTFAESFAARDLVAEMWDGWMGPWLDLDDFDGRTACAVRNALFATELLSVGDIDCDGAPDDVDPDTDDDGIPNDVDNCPGVANWAQNDNDTDGIGDPCDGDDDNDGVADGDDNCQFTWNPGQANNDEWGAGDACQDLDGDGIVDAVDGCPTAYNPDQADQDGDGKQDACDPDRDGDGWPNDHDGCPDASNPGQEDTDGGGIQDACDSDPDSPLNDWLQAFDDWGIPALTTVLRVKLPEICAGGCPEDFFDPAHRIRFEFEGLADTSIAMITDARGLPVARVQPSADQTQIIEFSPETLGQLSLTLFGPAVTGPTNGASGQAGAPSAGASRGAAAAPADSPLDMTAIASDRFAVTMSMGTDLDEVPGATVTRRAGDNRFQTATAISAASFDPGGTVLIATGRAFPDALAAGPLARALHASVLLVEPDAVPATVVAELERLEPTQVVVLGGEGAISPAVAGRLAEVTGVTPVRLAGLNRYETASEVSAAGWSPGVDTVFLATGLAAPDALAGGALAGTMGAPLLLTHQASLSAATRAELVRLEPRRVIVLGGAAAVSDEVVAELAELADVVERLSGLDRYETAAAIADANPFRTRTAYVATGLDFPDALAAASAASMVGAPILLSRQDGLPAATVGAVQEIAPHAVIAVGGAGVIRESVLTELRALVE